MLAPSRALLEHAGFDLASLDRDPRRLLHPVGGALGDLEVLILRPGDVCAYVEHGACTLGIVGSDVVAEERPDVLVPLDLGFGACRMCLAGPPGADPFRLESPRVATKYPRIAAELFLERGTPAQVIALSGAVEIAPLVGLADVIVDLVETGETLSKNGLEVIETIFNVSARLVLNRAALKLHAPRVRSLRTGIERALLGAREERAAEP